MIATEPLIRVTVIGGYLGAGKTTLLNSVLGRADERVAVLVNDFGDVDIDGELIENDDGSLIRLANGCICCSLVDGFSAALSTIAASVPRPQRLLIEASGVSDPAMVAAYGHAPGFELDAVVVVVDADSIIARSRDRFVGDTVLGQLRAADVVVLNKVGLAGPERTAAAHVLLDERCPGVLVIEVDHAAVPLDLLTAPQIESARPTGPSGAERMHSHSPDERFETWTLEIDGPVDRQAVDIVMQELSHDVLRVKGLLRFRSEPGRHVLQRVGGRWTIEPTQEALSGQPESSTLVFIGVPGSIDRDGIRRRLVR